MELISTINDRKKWGQPPINLDFQVPMFTACGLRIRFLKVGLRVSEP